MSDQWRFVCPNCGSCGWRVRTSTRPPYRCTRCKQTFAALFDKKRDTTLAVPDATPTEPLATRLARCTPAARDVFDIIRDEHPISFSAVVAEASASRGSVAALLRQLREAGTVARTQSAADERKRLYRPLVPPGEGGR